MIADILPLLPAVFVSDPSAVRLWLVGVYAGYGLVWNIVAYAEHLTKRPEGWSLRQAFRTVYLGAIIGLLVAVVEPAVLTPVVAAATGLAVPVVDELFGVFRNVRAQIAHADSSWSDSWFR